MVNQPTESSKDSSAHCLQSRKASSSTNIITIIAQVSPKYLFSSRGLAALAAAEAFSCFKACSASAPSKKYNRKINLWFFESQFVKKRPSLLSMGILGIWFRTRKWQFNIRIISICPVDTKRCHWLVSRRILPWIPQSHTDHRQTTHTGSSYRGLRSFAHRLTWTCASAEYLPLRCHNRVTAWKRIRN